MTKQDKDIALRVTKQFYKDVISNTIPMPTAQAFLEQTIVAGGAIRDTIFDKEVRDIMENPGNPYVSISEREKFLEAIHILKGEDQ